MYGYVSKRKKRDPDCAENSSEAKKTTQQVELIFLSLKLKLELNFKMSNFLFFAYRLVATQLICFCVNFVHHHLFS